MVIKHQAVANMDGGGGGIASSFSACNIMFKVNHLNYGNGRLPH